MTTVLILMNEDNHTNRITVTKRMMILTRVSMTMTMIMTLAMNHNENCKKNMRIMTIMVMITIRAIPMTTKMITEHTSHDHNPSYTDNNTNDHDDSAATLLFRGF